MTLRQRVGQLFMVKLPTLAAGASISGAITTWHIGNVWIGRQTAGVTAIRAVTDALQHLTRDTATGGVPLFVSANQEGGSIQGLSGPGFATIPSAVTQGSWSVAKLETQAAVWGGDLAEAGVNADFAPVADVVPDGTQSQNAPIGQLRREYGTEPGPVADHVVAFIDGLHDAGVATTVKHFPGLGRVEGNTDNVADVVDDVTTRDDAYLEPFQAAIADGSTEFAMISLATYTRIDPDHLAVFSPTVMRDMLRGELGFDGVIMSDSLTATAVVSIAAGTRAIRFLEAGGDLVVLTPVDTAVAMVKAVVARATSNATFRSLVDASALRVLEAKAKAGLLSCG
jgi:beta-N-acetylhexosaminidase